jgi:phosphocarrier protein
MRKAELAIVNKLGLHARAASRFVSEAGHFASRIQLRHHGDWIDGKSIMAVMLLAAGCGSVLEVKVEGPDEDAALEALRALVENRFGEAE